MLGIEQRVLVQVLVIGVVSTHHIATALTHRHAFAGRNEVFAVFKRENTAVSQDVGVVKQEDVVVPFADAVGPVVHVIDEIHVQGVPLAVFPITNAVFGRFT